MKNIKLVIEYDGTNYLGWQKQKNGVTIQGVLEEAISKATGERVDVIGSSRTDSGVHAKGFVANFKTSSTIPPERFREALNVKLPNDIVIIESMEVNSEFHSRYNAKGKTYSYTICNKDVPPAIARDYMYYFKGKLDIEAIKEACKYFIGTHDFNAFKSKGSSVKTTVRTISDMYIKEDEGYIKVFVTGDGFLYNMVRIIVGTLLMVGMKKIEPGQVENIIKNKNRKEAGVCVPATGLVLEKVFY